jgi:hypothetical protein
MKVKNSFLLRNGPRHDNPPREGSLPDGRDPLPSFAGSAGLGERRSARVEPDRLQPDALSGASQQIAVDYVISPANRGTIFANLFLASSTSLSLKSRERGVDCNVASVNTIRALSLVSPGTTCVSGAI